MISIQSDKEPILTTSRRTHGLEKGGGCGRGKGVSSIIDGRVNSFEVGDGDGNGYGTGKGYACGNLFGGSSIFSF